MFPLPPKPESPNVNVAVVKRKYVKKNYRAIAGCNERMTRKRFKNMTEEEAEKLFPKTKKTVEVSEVETVSTSEGLLGEVVANTVENVVKVTEVIVAVNEPMEEAEKEEVVQEDVVVPTSGKVLVMEESIETPEADGQEIGEMKENATVKEPIEQNMEEASTSKGRRTKEADNLKEKHVVNFAEEIAQMVVISSDEKKENEPVEEPMEEAMEEPMEEAMEEPMEGPMEEAEVGENSLPNIEENGPLDASNVSDRVQEITAFQNAPRHCYKRKRMFLWLSGDSLIHLDELPHRINELKNMREHSMNEGDRREENIPDPTFICHWENFPATCIEIQKTADTDGDRFEVGGSNVEVEKNESTFFVRGDQQENGDMRTVSRLLLKIEGVVDEEDVEEARQRIEKLADSFSRWFEGEELREKFKEILVQIFPEPN